MKLNKADLARKLGCSERALTNWQQQPGGLPVLEHGRRGQSNTYDLGAVVAWIKSTGAGLVHNNRLGRTAIDIAGLERELSTSTQAAGEELFNYLTEHGRVRLAARFYGAGRDIDQALELTGDCFDVLWNLCVDRFGMTDFSKKSEALLNFLYDERDPDREALVARIYAVAAMERARRAPELALGPPVQTSGLLSGAELQDEKGDDDGPGER